MKSVVVESAEVSASAGVSVSAEASVSVEASGPADLPASLEHRPGGEGLRTLSAVCGRFEAARYLAGLPTGHRARARHGHGFIATATAALPVGLAAGSVRRSETFGAQMRQCVETLDYSDLNHVIDEPTDANIAHWLRARLAVPGIEGVAVQSTPDQGVELHGGDRVSVWRRYRFQAAHRLPHGPVGHKCGRLHGHGFQVILYALLPDDEARAGMGHDRLDIAWTSISGLLGFRCLNDVAGLENPTSEMLASWIWTRLKPRLPDLVQVAVYETASCGAVYDGQRYRIWKDFTLDSAVRSLLARRGRSEAPGGSEVAGNPERAGESATSGDSNETDSEAAVFGHTFLLRLHLAAPLDALLGWTVDFGDVKAIFDPVFRSLDHHPLHELAGLDACDTASIAAWIDRRARPQLPWLDGLDLFETEGTGAILTAEPGRARLPI